MQDKEKAPGLLSPALARMVTYCSDNYLDGSRVGIYSMQKGYQYSSNQKMIRVAMLCSVGVAASIGYFIPSFIRRKLLSDTLVNVSSYQSVGAALASATITLYYTHKKAMQKTLQIRQSMMDKKAAYQYEIENLVPQLSVDDQEYVGKKIKEINAFSAATETKVNLSETLLARRNQMKGLLAEVQDKLVQEQPKEETSSLSEEQDLDYIWVDPVVSV